ncbi:MAG: hypothetical protein AAGA48_03360 [Myxococcota bacterium]
MMLLVFIFAAFAGPPPHWQVAYCGGDGSCHTELWGRAARRVARKQSGDAVTRWTPFDPAQGIDPAVSDAARSLGIDTDVRVFVFATPERISPTETTLPAPTRLQSRRMHVARIDPTVDALGRLGVRIFLLDEDRDEDVLGWIVVTQLRAEAPPVRGILHHGVRAMVPRCTDLGMTPLPVVGPTLSDQDPFCVRLPLGDGVDLTGTEWLMVEDGSAAYSCAVHAVGDGVGPPVCRHDLIGTPHDAAHYVQGVLSLGAGPSLVEAWFEVEGDRFVVLNQSRGPGHIKCIGAFPKAGRAPQPQRCVGEGPTGSY